MAFARIIGYHSLVKVKDLVAQEALQVCGIAACCLHLPACATDAFYSICMTIGHCWTMLLTHLLLCISSLPESCLQGQQTCTID